MFPFLGQQLRGGQKIDIIGCEPASCPSFTKILENVYRAVNIAFINELAILCNMLDIDIWEVVEAAKTKPFGFESFRPGPGVGGHCIPIDPNYLSFKTREIGKPVRFVELAQEINNTMPSYIVGRILEKMNSLEKPMNNSNILILGVAYKKDISDTRESPSIDIIGNLHSKGVNVSYYDPFVANLDINTPINRELDVKNFNNYDLILFHTAHSEFSEINFEEINVPIFDATGTDYLINSDDSTLISFALTLNKLPIFDIEPTTMNFAPNASPIFLSLIHI